MVMTSHRLDRAKVYIDRIVEMNVFPIRAAVTILVIVGILGTILAQEVRAEQSVPVSQNSAASLPSMSNSLGGHNAVFFAQNSGTAEWYHTTGLLTITSSGVSSSRHIEVWAAPDGRYRVKSTQLDGVGGEEEVAYDARGNQLVRILPAIGAESEYFVVKNDKHFAITASPQGMSMHHVNTPYQNLLIKEMTYTTASSAVHFSSNVVSRYRGDPSALTIAIPADATINTEQLLMGKQVTFSQSSSTFAARRQTVLDLYSMPCMVIRNYRNTATNFFAATSKRISDLSRDHACKWVHVATWALGYLNGWCLYDWQGQGSISSSYSIWVGTIDNTLWQETHGSNVAACSSHSAWDRYWTPHVTGYHLPAAIPG